MSNGSSFSFVALRRRFLFKQRIPKDSTMSIMNASGCKPDEKEIIPPTVSFGAYSRQGLQPYAVGGFFAQGCRNHGTH
jgi:hypothetical protein